MSKVIAILVIILMIFSLYAWIDTTKDYPQCRWTRDPVMCVELMKGMQNDK